jgi:uncharacterized protein
MADEQQPGGSGAEREDATTDGADGVSSRGASERLCVGCRQSSPREELLRFAIPSHAMGPDAPLLVPDPQRKLGGRGVSVHPTRRCVELAVRKGGFARALRKSVQLDVGALCGSAALLYVMRAESLLIAAARRKKLAIGTDAVRDALRGSAPPGTPEGGTPSGERGIVVARSAPVELLVVAADAEGRREELTATAERLGRRCTVFGTKFSLGRLFGRDEVGVLGVLDRGIADEVVRCTAHATELESPVEHGGRAHGGASVRLSEGE